MNIQAVIKYRDREQLRSISRKSSGGSRNPDVFRSSPRDFQHSVYRPVPNRTQFAVKGV
jgi:hypothetical protein